MSGLAITNSKKNMNCETEADLTFLYNLVKKIEGTVKDQEQEIKDLKECLNMRKRDRDFSEEKKEKQLKTDDEQYAGDGAYMFFKIHNGC